MEKLKTSSRSRIRARRKGLAQPKNAEVGEAPKRVLKLPKKPRKGSHVVREANNPSSRDEQHVVRQTNNRRDRYNIQNTNDPNTGRDGGRDAAVEGVLKVAEQVRQKNEQKRRIRTERAAARTQKSAADYAELFKASFLAATGEAYAYPIPAKVAGIMRKNLRGIRTERPVESTMEEVVRRWNDIRTGPMKWADQMPRKPDADFFAYYSRYLIRALGELEEESRKRNELNLQGTVTGRIPSGGPSYANFPERAIPSAEEHIYRFREAVLGASRTVESASNALLGLGQAFERSAGDDVQSAMARRMAQETDDMMMAPLSAPRGRRAARALHPTPLETINRRTHNEVQETTQQAVEAMLRLVTEARTTVNVELEEEYLANRYTYSVLLSVRVRLRATERYTMPRHVPSATFDARNSLEYTRESLEVLGAAAQESRVVGYMRGLVSNLLGNIQEHLRDACEEAADSGKEIEELSDLGAIIRMCPHRPEHAG